MDNAAAPGVAQLWRELRSRVDRRFRSGRTPAAAEAPGADPPELELGVMTIGESRSCPLKRTAQIDHGLLTHPEQALERSVEVRDQEHDSREREHEGQH